MRPRIPLERFEVFADGLDHPEGLAFDADGALWAGGEAGQIYRITRAGRVQLVTSLGGFNLGLTFSPRQELFVCNFKKTRADSARPQGQSAALMGKRRTDPSAHAELFRV